MFVHMLTLVNIHVDMHVTHVNMHVTGVNMQKLEHVKISEHVRM